MTTAVAQSLRTSAICLSLFAVLVGFAATSDATPGMTATVGVGSAGVDAVPADAGEPINPQAVVSRVRRADLGNSWMRGCPTRPRKLRAIDVNHWDYDAQLKRGRIIVHRTVVPVVRRVLRKAFKTGFRIHEVSPVQKYNSSDNKSMRADNTSGFSCRRIPGSTRWSEHAKGTAVDINPRRNPHVFPHKLLPGNAKDYVSRAPVQVGMLTKRSKVTRVFSKRGWTWGGSYRNPDYQHYSLSGR